jgi:hypothetical protein
MWHDCTYHGGSAGAHGTFVCQYDYLINARARRMKNMDGRSELLRKQSDYSASFSLCHALCLRTTRCRFIATHNSSSIPPTLPSAAPLPEPQPGREPQPTCPSAAWPLHRLPPGRTCSAPPSPVPPARSCRLQAPAPHRLPASDGLAPGCPADAAHLPDEGRSAAPGAHGGGAHGGGAAAAVADRAG